MSRTHSLQNDVLRPARWAVTLVVLAVVAAMSAPIGAMAAQTPTATTGEGIISMVPESALAFAQINLDTSSDQMILASQLFERAGLGDPIEQMNASGEFPANATVGIVVTSIPETEDIDITSMSVDPTLATESLDEGGFAAIIRGEGLQQILDDQLQEMQHNAEMDGGELTESEYGGITITAFVPSGTDDYVDGAAVAMVGDVIVTAARADDIHPIIDTFNGDTENLSTNENYQNVNALLPAESISNGYFDGPATLAALEAGNPGALDAADPRATELLDSWTGFALSAEQDGFRFVSKSIAADGEFDEMTPIDGSFFDKVRSDALFAVNGTDIDATGALTMLAFVFASEFNGDDLTATPVADIDLEAEQERVFAQAEQLLGFNLKTDFIDHLTGEFGLTVSVGDIMSDTPAVNALIVSHVDNPQAVTGTMAKIALIVGAAMGDQTAVTDRQVGDATVNSVDISETGLGDTIDFGVIGDDLVIGVGTGVDDYANGAESPMSGDPNFSAVMEHLPGEYGRLTYVNVPELLELVLGLSGSMGMSSTDADPSCGEYATQADAQAAYDEDQFENYELDQDFDGEACEDFFAEGVATPTAPVNPYENILGMGTVTTLEDGVYGSETFLMIGGE